MKNEQPVELTEEDFAVLAVENEIAGLERELEGYTRYGRDERAAEVEDAIAAAKKRRKALKKGKGDAPDADTAQTAVPNDPGKQTAVPPAPGTEPPAPTRPDPKKAKTAEQPADDGLSALKVADLKKVAADKGIDLGSATRKDDIIAAIRKAPAAS